MPTAEERRPDHISYRYHPWRWRPEVDHVHGTDADDAWQEDFGRFLRIRVILSIIGIDAIWSIVTLLHFNDWKYFAILALPATLLATTLIILRFLLLNRVWADKQLHIFFHRTRDDVNTLLSAGVRAGEDPEAMGKYIQAWDKFNNDVAERIANYFRYLLSDRTITCAIRLASDYDQRKVYRTVGRSTGMSTVRAKLSEGIPADKGIAKHLADQNESGVCIIRSISGAIERGWWLETKTDSLPDIRTTMVAPINGYWHGEKRMLGILYINSKLDVFSKKHADFTKAISDFLGMVYPLVTPG